MKVYVGKREKVGARVYVDEGDRVGLLTYQGKPDAFDWGKWSLYTLWTACELLSDALGRRVDLSIAATYGEQVCATWGDEWTVTSEQILSWWHTHRNRACSRFRS